MRGESCLAYACPLIADRVKETTTTAGTGTLTLLGAVTGFVGFGSVFADADTCYYVIVSQTPGEWEDGIGTIGGGGTTLARTTPRRGSSGDDTLVNFSAGTKDIFVDLPSWAATTLPITGSADLVVLTDASTFYPLIALDADEVLTFLFFNLGEDPPYATEGSIRAGEVFSIFGLDGDQNDVPVLLFDGDTIVFGDDVLATIDFYADKCAMTMGNGGAIGFNALDGNKYAALAADVTGTPYFQMVVADAAGAQSSVLLEGLADANAFYPSQGTPNLGTAAFPWGSVYAANLVSIANKGRLTAQAAAAASVVAYTVGATDESLEISANVLVTTATVHSFVVTVAYTDEGNTTRTVSLNFNSLSGTLAPTIANAGGTIPYAGVPLHLRCKAATAVTVATSGTFTTVAYNVEGIIRKLGT